MNIATKNIIWGSAKHWTSSSPVGSHGYAKEFIKDGWRILFLTSNITPIHRFLTRDQNLFKERYLLNKSGGQWHENGKLLDFVPWGLVPAKHMPNIWMELPFGDTNRTIKRNHFDDPALIWIDTAEFGALFKKFPNAKHVLRIADKNQFFKGAPKNLIKEQINIAKLADLVIVTSYALEKEMNGFGITNIVRIENGVNIEKFQPAVIPDKPTEYMNIQGPIAVFVGMVEHWFDIKLINEVAYRLPHVNFVIIGKVGIDVTELTKRKNVYLFGPRSPELVPGYLYHSHVGIIPFEISEFGDAINPVKYFEYIACGLPVVATDSLEFRMLKQPVYLARTAEEFADNILKGLNESESNKKVLQEIARTMSWQGRWEFAMKYIES